MQRICSKFRTLSQISINTTIRTPLFSPPFNPTNFQYSSPFSAITSQIKSQITASSTPLSLPGNGFTVSPLGFHYVQMRSFSVKSKERKRKILTPATSKVKKIKMKTLSALKGRFKTLRDGTIRRWRAGKRHNAHLKSKKSKRRLRKPEIVPSAYAKVMKKMNFCAHY